MDQSKIIQPDQANMMMQKNRSNEKMEICTKSKHLNSNFMMNFCSVCSFNLSRKYAEKFFCNQRNLADAKINEFFGEFSASFHSFYFYQSRRPSKKFIKPQIQSTLQLSKNIGFLIRSLERS